MRACDGPVRRHCERPVSAGKAAGSCRYRCSAGLDRRQGYAHADRRQVPGFQRRAVRIRGAEADRMHCFTRFLYQAAIRSCGLKRHTQGSRAAISGGWEPVFDRSPAYRYRIPKFHDRERSFMYDKSIGGNEKWFSNYSSTKTVGRK